MTASSSPASSLQEGVLLHQFLEGDSRPFPMKLPARLVRNTKLLVIDAHAGGEPAKIVIDGIGQVEGM